MLNKMVIFRCMISRSRAAGISRLCCANNSAGIWRSLSSATYHGVNPNLWIPPSPAVDGDAELVGHSHGWSALFNKRSNDLFLSDPLSHRRINLPPIHTLPDPDFNLDLDGLGSVSKVVLSSSPDDGNKECRAMMSFGPANRVAYCVPGRSSEWVPMGRYFFQQEVKDPFRMYARVHEDLVYCTRRRVFTSVTACSLHLPFLLYDRNAFIWLSCDDIDDDNFPLERWNWDVRDPNFPKIATTMVRSSKYKPREKSPTRIWMEENSEVLENECVQIPHLVYAEESDQLFLLMRFVRLRMGFVPRCEVRGLSGTVKGDTFGFVVIEIKEEKDKHGDIVCTIEDDLNGMAMFVGNGMDQSSSAILASSHQLCPNSIYFTDAKRIPRLCCADDTGVFDYATKTITTQ
ncbi:hypothetical protein OROGR_018135 [Orobanche gracilis]